MRDRLLDFVLALDAITSDQAVEHDWGRAFLSPSLPMVWDANGVVIERPGMSAAEVIAAGDEALADLDFRTIVIRDEAEGARLAEEISAEPGWEVEIDLFMVLRGDGERPPADPTAREVKLSECEGLRRSLIRGEFPAEMAGAEETTEQLLERNRRFARTAGDRWFVAPPDRPASACCLLAETEIGQVEDVGTLASARGRGHAQAVISAAIAASRQAGHRITFIVADADDWPRLLYERLGFETCGTLHVFRRAPTAGISP